MRVFVLGVPHMPDCLEYPINSFSTNVVNLCRMLVSHGHAVTHFGIEGSTAPCAEFVPVGDGVYWAGLYGPESAWFNRWDAVTPVHRAWGDRFVVAVRDGVNARVSKDYEVVVCVTWGGLQWGAVAGFVHPQLVVESGIGYRHPAPGCRFRVFPSYAWMNWVHGEEQRINEGWYDVVIPHAVDGELFPFRAGGRGDRFLFVGRLEDLKGAGIAVETTGAIGARLLVVGPGDGGRFADGNPHVEVRPWVGRAELAALMGEARAVFCPSRYLEPFGYVAVEAQLCGTPVITTDFGAYPETVVHGVTGFRCRTLEQFCWAALHVGELRPDACRAWAVGSFGLGRVGRMYDEYLRMVGAFPGAGWQRMDLEGCRGEWLGVGGL